MSEDPRSVWIDQPHEDPIVDFSDFATRRTRKLRSSTRADIAMSIAAILFFAAMVAWRIAWAGDRVPLWAWAAIAGWVLISLYWFRDRLWRNRPPQGDLAAAGADYYRTELARRRDHLRNEWVWHGPLLLAGLVLVASALHYASRQRWLTIIPLFVLLAAWTGFDAWRRHRQAAELQREIDEIVP